MFLGKSKLLVLLSLITTFLLPSNVFAIEKCAKQGYTIATINGVFTNESGATKNANALFDRIGETYKGELLVVKYLLNPSHLGGLGDIVASVYQKIFDQEKIEDYDLVEMLKTASEQVHTQKLLLVAHSQGNFYANSFYDVVADKVGGVPKKSIGVYSVATPAGRVVGGGKWLTSDTDTIIAGIAARAPFKDIMAPNTHIELQNGDDTLGHSFSDVYLKYRGDRIVADIEDSLNKLSENNIQGEQELCIDPPELTLAHKAVGVVLAVADPIANVGSDAVVGAVAITYKANKFIAQVGERASLAMASTGNFLTQFLRKEIDVGGLALVSEINLNNTAAAEKTNDAATANIVDNKNVGVNKVNEINQPSGPQKNLNTSDTQDKNAAEAAAKQKQPTTNNNQQQTTINLNSVTVTQQAAAVSGAGQGEATVLQCKYGSAGGTPTHQKFLINEVAWMGGPASANDEWLELKNISGSELDLSGWQILDKDEQIKIIFSNGEKVPAGGFLLLERTNDNSLPGIAADLIYSGALSNTDEGLRLFDKNCVLIDEVLANPDWPAGESIARKTMERSSDLSWHTSSIIMGTPKKENSSNNNSNVSTPLVAQNILISEIQTTGGTGQADNEFIELYNPNDSIIDLSVLPLNLHIRNSAGTDSHKLLTFINKAIPARGYFLIGPASGYTGSAALDATYSTSSGNKLVNNGGAYISKSSTADADILDKIGWGTQAAGGYETAAFPENPIANQSISRQSANDTGNNFSDFIKSKPTPKNSSNSGGFLNPEAWVVSEQLVNHIVISEIYPDRTGANLDFVELYNPNATSTGDLDISGWSLQVLSANATSTDKIVKKNFVTGNKISGRGFFLIGIDNYPATDMNWASGSLNSTDGATIFLVSGTTTISDLTDSRIVDRVSYGGGSAADFSEGVAVVMPATRQSLERRAFQNDLCVSSQNSGEFFGNGCDTDDNAADFELRTVPNPQTTQKFPEPRTTPSLPQNFFAVYASSSAQMLLSWDASKDYKGATSTLSYSLSYATSTAALKNLTTVSATTTYSFKADDVGTDYLFSVSAKDSEGLSSLAATTSVVVSSPLSHFYFYKDSRSTTSKKYLFDLYYDSYPFVPDIYNRGTGRILVFYLNKEAPTEIELKNANQFSPENPDGTVKDGVVGVVYPRCSGDSSTSSGSPGFSLILPGPCGTDGGAENATLTSGSLEDLYLLIKLAKTTDEVIFTEQDFVTVGMYSFAGSGGGSQWYQLAVLDKNKYFFQSQVPSHNPPKLGGALALNFNKQKSQLEIEWQKAIDSDTLDNLITYEISYDGGTSWQSIGVLNKTQKIVAPKQNFSILVRAKDDFGNYSDPPLVASWSYPETIFYITQAQANDWSASFGDKNQNCPSCPGTASLQSIQPEEDFEFNTVTLKLRQEQVSDTADIQLAVYPDLNNRPDFNSLIAEAQLKDMIRIDQNSDITFTFDTPISVSSNINYWLVLSVEKYSDSRGFLRNSWQNAINTGSDFYGSGQAGRGNSGTCAGYCNFTVPYPDAATDWYMKIGFTQ